MTTRNRRSVVTTAGVAGAGGPAGCLFDEWRRSNGKEPSGLHTQGATDSRLAFSSECVPARIEHADEQHATVATATKLLEGA